MAIHPYSMVDAIELVLRRMNRITPPFLHTQRLSDIRFEEVVLRAWVVLVAFIFEDSDHFIFRSKL